MDSNSVSAETTSQVPEGSGGTTGKLPFTGTKILQFGAGSECVGTAAYFETQRGERSEFVPRAISVKYRCQLYSFSTIYLVYSQYHCGILGTIDFMWPGLILYLLANSRAKPNVHVKVVLTAILRLDKLCINLHTQHVVCVYM